MIKRLKQTKFGLRGWAFKDISGQKFGRLQTVNFFRINKNKRAEWIFKCDCGNEKIAEGKLVRKGAIKSCGCLWMEAISLPKGEAAFNHHFLGYKTGAEKRKLEFSLSKLQFRDIVIQKCFYCGQQPRTVGKKNTPNGRFKAHGIDRINNKKGYTIFNSVSCCKQCNIAKATYSRTKFLNWVKKVYSHNFGE